MCCTGHLSNAARLRRSSTIEEEVNQLTLYLNTLTPAGVRARGNVRVHIVVVGIATLNQHLRATVRLCCDTVLDSGQCNFILSTIGVVISQEEHLVRRVNLTCNGVGFARLHQVVVTIIDYLLSIRHGIGVAFLASVYLSI